MSQESRLLVIVSTSDKLVVLMVLTKIELLLLYIIRMEKNDEFKLVCN